MEENKNLDVEINLNPDGIEVDNDMIVDEIKIQKEETGELLVQDKFNEDDIFEISTEDSEIEVIE